MKNYYEILNVNKDANQEEIKSGYKKMLRKYPPEKEQEKYKEIREAYDTLKDEKSRKNYNAYFHHEKDIKTLEDKYTEYMEAKNYNEAEKVLKKILIISPEIAHIKDKLGEVFFLEENYNKSIEIYKELIKEYPENVDYLIKLAGNYSQLKFYDKSRVYYLKAYDLDDSNPDAISGVMNSYIGENKISEAISFLNGDIEKDNKLDFEDFFALSKLLECYIIKNDMPNLKNTLEKIKKIAPEDEESKGFISWKLGQLAAKLSDMGIYEYSKEILEISLKLTPNIDLIKELYKHVDLFVEANKLVNDTSIYAFSKLLILNYFFGENYKESERKEWFENLNYRLRSSSEREKIKQGIYIIEQKYPKLFKELEIKIMYTELLATINKSTGACYIATAVYGSYDSDEVLVLRRFRDEILKKTKAGRKIVAFYYKYSPYLSKKLKLNSVPSNIIKCLLNNFIKFLNKYILK
ncbi:tetratricopeptide repeat protein [Fusobacterium hwasookii]|uniref:tetratricopeptide repeat protein n=1 Tax=Fusobacterium hwasookii TaxID=1583098 RepID=UPI0004977DED|nr:CFI-box-CTERM domain-containing protein [Fusobacterium hwasookii]ALQ37101.1 hypothetical protein RN97_02525 [Fusobacterium hwasookii ChDC F300]